jgi:hypothetical protein
MANHAVVIPNKLAAKNIDSYVRAVSCSSLNIDNGNLLQLTGKSAISGESETWAVSFPVTGSLIGLWMALEPEMPSAFAGTKQYRGLGTVQDFYNVAGQDFTAVKLVPGDIFTITGDGFASGSTAPTSGSAYAVATTASFTWTWASGSSLATSTQTTAQYVGTTYISIPDGNISTQRVTAFQFQVISN